MPINILMPALSPTMTEGTLAKWHVKEGDDVDLRRCHGGNRDRQGDHGSRGRRRGHRRQALVAEGTEGVPVNTAIAVLLEEGEDAGAIRPRRRATAARCGPAPAPRRRNGGAATAPAPQRHASGAGRRFGQRRRPYLRQPLARRMAEQASLDIGNLKGSGPHGRIVKVDIEAALVGGAPGAQPAAAPTGGALVPAPAAVPATSGPSAKELADLLGMTYRAEPPTACARPSPGA